MSHPAPGEVPAATLVALNVDAVKLKALLGEMTGPEVKGLITTLTVESEDAFARLMDRLQQALDRASGAQVQE